MKEGTLRSRSKKGSIIPDKVGTTVPKPRAYRVLTFRPERNRWVAKHPVQEDSWIFLPFGLENVFLEDNLECHASKRLKVIFEPFPEKIRESEENFS